MSSHNWVELTVTPVTAEVDENEHVRFYTSEEAEEIAKEDRLYLCWSCKAEPSLVEFYEPCPGAPTPEQLREM